jgi:hypothetical protein
VTFFYRSISRRVSAWLWSLRTSIRRWDRRQCDQSCFDSIVEAIENSIVPETIAGGNNFGIAPQIQRNNLRRYEFFRQLKANN